VRFDDATEAFGDLGNGVVPRNGLELPHPFAPFPTERRGQTSVGIGENAVVGDRALSAELTATDRMVPVTSHTGTLAVSETDDNAARVVAITRTRGPDLHP
jgi:hypothetical protein